VIEFVRFMLICARAYRCARSRGCCYFNLVNEYRVPVICAYVAVGREAWRATAFALDLDLFNGPGH